MARHTRLQVTQGMSVPTKPITVHEHFVEPDATVSATENESFSFSKLFTMTNILIALLLLVVLWLGYNYYKKTNCNDNNSSSSSKDILDDIVPKISSDIKTYYF